MDAVLPVTAPADARPLMLEFCLREERIKYARVINNGEVPEDILLLEELPGVGHKTASVVMSQSFGHPMFPVDTHIHRLLTRWGVTSGKNVVETEKDAKKAFPKESWNKLHLQIIFYGREYSPARSPKKAKDYITNTIGTKAAISELV